MNQSMVFIKIWNISLLKLISKNKKVVSFSLDGYWLDVGKHDDYNKAQIDVKKIKF